MKAIELLRVLRPDLMTYDGSVSLRDWFGAVSHEGEMLHGTYFYTYLYDYDLDVSVMPAPDVKVHTEEAGDVWLWKVEG